MSTSEMDVPFGTCDWGGCDELAVARRRCPCCDDELMDHTERDDLATEINRRTQA